MLPVLRRIAVRQCRIGRREVAGLAVDTRSVGTVLSPGVLRAHMPEIKVPAALTGGSSSETVAVEGSTVGEALESHAGTHGPELRDSVLEDGRIKEFINVFVDGENVDHLDGLSTRLADDAQIRVVPAASGGWQPRFRRS